MAENFTGFDGDGLLAVETDVGLVVEQADVDPGVLAALLGHALGGQGLGCRNRDQQLLLEKGDVAQAWKITLVDDGQVDLAV